MAVVMIRMVVWLLCMFLILLFLSTSMNRMVQNEIINRKLTIDKEEDEGGSGGDFVDVLLDLEKENILNDSDKVTVLLVISCILSSCDGRYIEQNNKMVDT